MNGQWVKRRYILCPHLYFSSNDLGGSLAQLNHLCFSSRILEVVLLNLTTAYKRDHLTKELVLLWKGMALFSLKEFKERPWRSTIHIKVGHDRAPPELAKVGDPSILQPVKRGVTTLRPNILRNENSILLLLWSFEEFNFEERYTAVRNLEMLQSCIPRSCVVTNNSNSCNQFHWQK